MHGSPPPWGISGEGNEEITRTIMCCVSGAFDEVAASNASTEAAVAKYEPQAYGRFDGWAGRTYPEAVQFCGGESAAGGGRERGLCPYEGLCPLGPRVEPLGGAGLVGGSDGDGAWLPIMDGANEWVRAGCVAYSHEHPNRPAWGMSGEGSEELTREIVCCLRREEDSGEEDAVLYQMAAEGYHPRSYDRSKGWLGQSFEEALDFCDGVEGYELCTYGMSSRVLFTLSIFVIMIRTNPSASLLFRVVPSFA